MLVSKNISAKKLYELFKTERLKTEQRAEEEKTYIRDYKEEIKKSTPFTKTEETNV